MVDMLSLNDSVMLLFCFYNPLFAGIQKYFQILDFFGQLPAVTRILKRG